MIWGLRQQNTVFAAGNSIIDRSSKTNIGELMLAYGGGGHEAAGTCQIDNDRAGVLGELIAQDHRRRLISPSEAAARGPRSEARQASRESGELEADEDREAIRHRLCSEYESIAAHERHLMARFEAIIAESWPPISATRQPTCARG